MSRIGKVPVPVPTSVEIKIAGQHLAVKGPKGELAHEPPADATIERNDDGMLQISRVDDSHEARAMHGLPRTLVSNLAVGVTDGDAKKLEDGGPGYRGGD